MRRGPLRLDVVGLAVAIARILIQLIAIRPYGYFRDELYYLACSDHLAWGYVDHPPLSIAVLRLWRAAFGDSLVAIRMFPAITEAAVAYLTVRTARRLGASSYGAGLAGFAVLTAPAFFGFAHYFSMNTIDHLVWTAAAALAVRLAVQPDDARVWLTLGVVFGLGALNKWSVAWLAPGLAVGLAVTPARRALRTPWPYASAAIAMLLVAPHMLWQVRAGWPTLEFMHNALANKYVHLSMGEFFGEVAKMINPAAVPLAIAGIVVPLQCRTNAGRALAAARPLAIVAAFAVVIVLSSHGKPEYLLAAAPLVFASGAAAAELAARSRSSTAPRLLLGAEVLAMLALALIALPFGVPVFSETAFVEHMARVGVRPSSSEKKALGELPPFYADMHGWPELADAARLAWSTLSEDEKRRAKIWAVSGGYGPAAAIDFFGPARGLPHAISSHNSYWTWGYGNEHDDVVVLLGGTRERLERLFVKVDDVTTFECRWCMPYENHKPIYVGRGMRQRWADVWPLVRHFE